MLADILEELVRYVLEDLIGRLLSGLARGLWWLVRAIARLLAGGFRRVWRAVSGASARARPAPPPDRR